ncbi:hypothetical protein G7Z99_00995 [Pseudomonas entomophila]|uniref:hypothetical protein n=1 Tax=Pseudomonas entomophila TaxID=312306 RepID=UPI0015E2FCBC|nr:hypothetical protein [Pseudomonas entomophila]MBA1187623.1 hypothetical protein [Pseudomonas entomophila]
MSESTFEPLLCFNARCYWQFGEEPISERHLLSAVGKWVKPLWVEFNDWNGDDGWLMSGRDYTPKEIQSFLHDQVPFLGPRQRLYCEYFWFGVYQIGERHAYEIRPAYAGINVHRWPELQYVLDVSRGGYLGMYPTDVPAGSTPLHMAPAVEFVMPDPVPTLSLDLQAGPAVDSHGLLFRYRQGKVAPLWTIEGLEPGALEAGDIRTGLELYGPTGRKVRRLLEQGRAYLNDKRGHRGRLAIEVVHFPVPPHPKPNFGTP